MVTAPYTRKHWRVTLECGHSFEIDTLDGKPPLATAFGCDCSVALRDVTSVVQIPRRTDA